MYVLPYGQMSLWGKDMFYVLSMVPMVPKADKNFMSMFLGLVDGDGYIERGPQKQYNKSTVTTPKSTIRARLVIRLHTRDTSLLTYLTKVLGVGSISDLKSINQTRLIFSKKDLTTVIIPLIKKYDLHFLTKNRSNQFALLNYILDNNIVHWENVNFTPSVLEYSVQYLLNLSFFANWLVGFTIAEGSFGIKGKGEAFFQIKQKGIENYSIIKAISLLIVGREPNIKVDSSSDCYQLTLSSKLDVQKVVNFSRLPPLLCMDINCFNITNDLFLLSRVIDIKTLLFLTKDPEINLFSLNLYKICLKCMIINFLIGLFSFLLFIYSCMFIVETFLFSDICSYIALQVPFIQHLEYHKKMKGYHRVGPHNWDILSIIFGSLLGKGEAERRKDGTRITFNDKAIHLNYLLTLHSYLSAAGYCNPTVPTISKELGKKGKLYKTMSFNTWTFTSFDWIYDIWYINNTKEVPQSIGDYLTPLALAIWIMDSGVKSPQGLSFVNSFTYSDCDLLVKILHKNFGLKAKIQHKGVSSEYSIYILKESMIDLKNKVSIYLVPEMKYKLLS